MGYTDGICWTAGDGTSISASGYSGINGIKFDNSSSTKFLLSGINFSKDTNCVLVLMNGSEFVWADYLNSQISNTYTGVSTEINSDGSVVLTLTVPDQDVYKKANHFKVSGYGLGSNADIRKTE